MAISIGLIFSSQKRGPLNNFEWSWLGLCQHQTMINGRRTSQTWNCHRVTNKRTHTHTHKIIHDHGFWMRWRILLIGKDVSMVPFIDLMILTWLSFVSGVFNVEWSSSSSSSFFSKPLCFIFWWGTSDIKHCSPNHQPIKTHPWWWIAPPCHVSSSQPLVRKPRTSRPSGGPVASAPELFDSSFGSGIFVPRNKTYPVQYYHHYYSWCKWKYYSS